MAREPTSVTGIKRARARARTRATEIERERERKKKAGSEHRGGQTPPQQAFKGNYETNFTQIYFQGVISQILKTNFTQKCSQGIIFKKNANQKRNPLPKTRKIILKESLFVIITCQSVRSYRSRTTDDGFAFTAHNSLQDARRLSLMNMQAQLNALLNALPLGLERSQLICRNDPS